MCRGYPAIAREHSSPDITVPSTHPPLNLFVRPVAGKVEVPAPEIDSDAIENGVAPSTKARTDWTVSTFARKYCQSSRAAPLRLSGSWSRSQSMTVGMPWRAANVGHKGATAARSQESMCLLDAALILREGAGTSRGHRGASCSTEQKGRNRADLSRADVRKDWT